MSRLHFIMATVCTALAPVSTVAYAAEKANLQLFYQHNSHAKQSSKAQPEPVSVAEQSITKLPQKKAQLVTPLPKAKYFYKYNGFISSATGNHYFINGKSLTEIDSLQFISVKQGGRELELKAVGGQRFHIAIGQSVERRGP